jgi:hypothetical protein
MNDESWMDYSNTNQIVGFDSRLSNHFAYHCQQLLFAGVARCSCRGKNVK